MFCVAAIMHSQMQFLMRKPQVYMEKLTAVNFLERNGRCQIDNQQGTLLALSNISSAGVLMGSGLRRNGVFRGVRYLTRGAGKRRTAAMIWPSDWRRGSSLNARPT